MFDLFDEPWPALELKHVRAFLCDAGDEGATWEAKADDEKGRLHPDSLAKAACGLANQFGGYIIIGAKQEEKGGQWSLPGITPPRDEPAVWIGKVLRGLRPTPRPDEPMCWTLDDGRLVAVVRVEPVDQTPCMTRNGRIYERVTGQTLPVLDPALLERLIRRGDSARQRAEQFADRAATRALAAPEWPRAVGVSVALAPIGRETDDISSRLFVPSFRTTLEEKLRRYVMTAHPERGRFTPGTWLEIEQDALTALAHYEASPTMRANSGAQQAEQSTWRLQATWDGAVAAGIAFSRDAKAGVTSPEELLRPSWRAIDDLVCRLGGYGPARLAVVIQTTVEASGTILYGRLPEMTVIGRSVIVGDPDDATLGSVTRELQRAAGSDAFEPENDRGPPG